MTVWRQTPIPRETNRFHASHGMDQWLGDSRWAIDMCARAHPVGHRFVDLNLQETSNGVVNLHAGTAAENGYRYITVGRLGRRRKMTHAELHRPVSEWKTADVLRWRRTARPGRSRESRAHPRTYASQLAYCKRRKVVPCWEVKSLGLARFAVQIVAQMIRTRWTAYFMTLVYQTLHTPPEGTSMATAGRKLTAFHDAGAQTALLTHGFALPIDLDTWAPSISAYWGQNSDAYRKAAR